MSFFYICSCQIYFQNPVCTQVKLINKTCISPLLDIKVIINLIAQWLFRTNLPVISLIVCAGCKEELKEGQALIALEKEWHIWCFKCTSCEAVLHGEYMDKYE